MQLFGRISGVAALVITAAQGWAGAPTFEPIPPEVWNLTLKDSQGTGAILLERRMAFSGFNFEYFFRFRIVGETGKGILGVLTIPDRVEELRGRTVTHSGEVFPFTDRKDLIKKTVLQVGYFKAKETVVVPPGVSSDCVVEIGWREPQIYTDLHQYWTTFFHTYESFRIPLALPFPITKEVITIPDDFHLGWNIEGGAAAPVVAGSRMKTITFKDLPAMPEVPFCLESARDLPRLSIYNVPGAVKEAMGATADAFWNLAAHDYYKPLFTEASAGRAYKAWAKDLLKDLPLTPQAAAYELALRLDARIRNRSWPTYQETADLDKKALAEETDPKDLGQTVARGRTTAAGMVQIYFRLLQDAHLPPTKLLFVADRDRWCMDPNIRDVDQYSSVLVGIPEEGRPPLWVDPGLRFAQPGLINADYQGTLGLCVDTATWSATFIPVPVLGLRSSLQSYTCRLEVGEDEDTFKLEAAFVGHPEHLQRKRYLALQQAAQDKLLRERLEAQDARCQVTRTEVLNATDPRQNLAWRAEGRREREPGSRLAVDPFPLVPLPFHAPDAWPEQRTDPIILPHAGIFLARASFRIPAGYHPLPQEKFEHRNSFGAVIWAQEQVAAEAGPELQVALRVDVEHPTGGPERYQDLKDFMAWVREAKARLVVLEKP